MEFKCPRCNSDNINEFLPEVILGEEEIKTDCLCNECGCAFVAITDIEIRYFSTKYYTSKDS